MARQKMRKFKADNPNQDHKDFDRLLSEIFPQEVPVRFVTSIKVLYKDGTKKEMTTEELKGIVPNMMVDYKKISELWEDTEEVEIYLNIDLLKKVVEENTDRLLKKY
jgi:hypothetical protein